jgi:NADH dehydrogenase FAD-containing subunit
MSRDMTNMYDVVIIGAGASGFGCAITLSSANSMFAWAKDKKYLLIDDNNSDIKKASFLNLTGVSKGINGDELLNNMKTQLKSFNNCKTIEQKVLQIDKKDNNFTIKTNDNIYSSKIVVLATGMHKFDIKCDMVRVLPHDKIIKPNKIKLENINNKINDNLFVAGLASGQRTMFAIANGDGVKVACDILDIFNPKLFVPHDIIQNKKS